MGPLISFIGYCIIGIISIITTIKLLIFLSLLSIIPWFILGLCLYGLGIIVTLFE